MGHPILEALTFPLWLPEARALVNELVNSIEDPGDIKTLAKQAQVIDVEHTGVVRTLWLNVLSRAAELGRLGALVDEIVAEPRSPALTTAVEKVRNANQIGGSDYPHRMILKGPKVFIGRAKLREHLPKMQTPRGAILIVRGPAQTGRTETQNLLFDQNPDALVYVNQLVPLKDTMRHIWMHAAGYDSEPKPSHTTEPASFMAFWNDVHAALGDRKLRMWVLLDDLDKGAQRDEVILLGEKLAERMMTDSTFQDRFRLVLIGYPKTGLGGPLKPLEDLTHELKEEHVREFITYCCTVRDRNVGAKQIEKLAGDLCAQAKANVDEDTSFGTALNYALLDWYEDFTK